MLWHRKRRWQSAGGKGKDVSGTDVSDSASCSSGKTELVTAQSVADLVVLPGENDLDGALPEVLRCETDSDGSKFEVLCLGSSGEDDLGTMKSVVVRPGAPGEDDFDGVKSEVLRGEGVLDGHVFEALRSGDHELGNTQFMVHGHPAHRFAAQRRSAVVPAVCAPPVIGGKRAVRKAQRAEAGSDRVHSSSMSHCMRIC